MPTATTRLSTSRAIIGRLNSKPRDISGELRMALASNEVTVIKNASLYQSDRPQHSGKQGNTGTTGDSELEAGFPFRIISALRDIFHNDDPFFSINNVRMFGPISASNLTHYHGYSQKERERFRINGRINTFQAIVFILQTIAPYDEKTQTVNFGEQIENIKDENGNDAVILIYEKDGVLEKVSVAVGDMVVLPSGVYHSNSTLSGIYASYASIEVSDAADAMYQTHFYDSTRDFKTIIASTVERELGKRPDKVSSLTLASIPSINAYIRED